MTVYNPKMCDRIIELGKKGVSKMHMAVDLGVHRDTIYEWCKTHPEFEEAMQLAVAHSQVWWENIGQQGVQGKVDGFQSTPYIFIMKNRFREDYGETTKVETKLEIVSPVDQLNAFLKLKSENSE